VPAISVVLPTRDRPEFVRQALGSLAAQEFEDFEVVVADNPRTAPCEEVMREFDDKRFRYLRAGRPLAMHDNWESGCAEATGDYVAVMIDKTIWLPSTMSRALGTLEEASASVISWWDSGFLPQDERSKLTTGYYFPSPHPGREPVEFSGTGELARAMAFDVPRGGEGAGYFRGKICFGLYRRDLLDAMRDRFGRLFPPIAPDYTSRVGALLTATSLVDAGAPLQLSFATEISTGRRVGAEPLAARRFLDEVDPGVVDRLPIPGVYASHHNIVAHDYLAAERLGVAELDRRNLAARVREDLDSVEHWPSGSVRREQYRLLAGAERRAGVSRIAIPVSRAARSIRRLGEGARTAPRRVHEAQHRALVQRPRLHRALRRMRGKPPAAAVPKAPPPPPTQTLAEAISAAESRLTNYPERRVRDLRRNQPAG
jgi:Glycosyl transferase family 2